MAPWIDLALYFLLISLLAVGGVFSLLPEIHRYVVDVHAWMTAAEFTRLFAIAQAAPGPNILVVSLVGLKVGGIIGAIACTIAVCLPSSILMLSLSTLFTRHQDARWTRVVRAGLAPMTAGLTLASAYVITRGADGSIPAYAVTIVTAVLALTTRINFLWLLGAGALFGLLGLL